MHYRRYDMKDLVAIVEQAGFVIEWQSHLGFLLYPGFYLSKRFNQIRCGKARGRRRSRVSDMIVGTKKSSSLMRRVMMFERMLRSRMYFPQGVRCLLTARKP